MQLRGFVYLLEEYPSFPAPGKEFKDYVVRDIIALFIHTNWEILREKDALNSRAPYESSVIWFNPQMIKKYFRGSFISFMLQRETCCIEGGSCNWVFSRSSFPVIAHCMCVI